MLCDGSHIGISDLLSLRISNELLRIQDIISIPYVQSGPPVFEALAWPCEPEWGTAYGRNLNLGVALVGKVFILRTAPC